MEALGDGLKLMVKVFRRECHRVLHSERTTIHGADGMLMLLQLAMAEVRKQRAGDFKVALSDVLVAWKHLLLDKLHLQPPDVARLESYDLIREAYESSLKRSNAVDLVDVLAMYKQLRPGDSGDPGEPVSPIQLFEFLLGNADVSELPDSSVPSTPSRKSGPCSSQVTVAVRRVFCSYLNLLVNARSDMAAALTLDVPARALGRQAFTDLKHAARDADTSLFLAATSFVRAVQLGGKGYAPAGSDPLRRHVKGLSDFVQFLDSLQDVLGEVPDPSACGARLVTAIRAALVKGRGGEDGVRVAAEETAEQLKERICLLHRLQERTAAGGGSGVSPARPKAYAVNHCTAYGGRDTVKVLMALLDEEALAPPRRNKADLLSEDQPVLGGAEGTCVLALYRSPEVSTGRSPEPLKSRVQSRLDLLKPKAKERGIRSQFACTYKDDEMPLSRVLEFPSGSQVPTCVHPAPKHLTPPSPEEECRPDVKATPEAESPAERQSRGPPPPPGGVQPRSGNIRSGGADEAAPRGQRRGSKRKQAESERRGGGGSENEPPGKRALVAPGEKVAKAPSRKKKKKKEKLIAGQGKLTSFFRL
ncbi:PCNA-interacting partner [Pungitius pungitius]|uniref:PCNA-interacting partner n=1 Tax=Pungitius pungitius TaxID=134920 RepID=UPI002E1555CE